MPDHHPLSELIPIIPAPPQFMYHVSQEKRGIRDASCQHHIRARLQSLDQGLPADMVAAGIGLPADVRIRLRHFGQMLRRQFLKVAALNTGLDPSPGVAINPTPAVNTNTLPACSNARLPGSSLPINN